VSETATKVVIKTRTLTDTRTTSDSLAKTIRRIRSNTDTVSSSESVSGLHRVPRTATDTTSVSDAATRAAMTFHRIAISSTSISDDVSAAARVPVASFTYSPASGEEPLRVQFVDTSSNNPTGWLWDFGDGTTSREQNPLHIYAAGSWTISLTASNEAGSDTATV
jgi:PKD repeat protein